MDAFGTSVSMSLQYGVPLEDYVRKFSHMRFEPLGHTKNPDIRFAKSIIDYIFRWLGITFLPGYKEASRGVQPENSGNGGENSGESGDDVTETRPVAKRDDGQVAGQEAKAEPGEDAATETIRDPQAALRKENGHTNGYSSKLLERAGLMMESSDVGDETSPGSRSEQFAGFQVDAPSCDNCGSITVRNGNCYLCHNCGNSMGCS